jgi:hypothetical protein
MSRIDLYQLDEFNNDFAPNKLDGDVPMWDGANSQFKPVVRFGNSYLSTCVETPISTSSTTFQQAAVLTTPVLPIGTYAIFFCGLIQTGNTSASIELRIRENELSLLPVNIQVSTTNASEAAPVTCMCEKEITTARALSLDVFFRRQGANQPVTVLGSRFVVYRVK